MLALAARRGLSVYLLGADPATVARAAEVIPRLVPGLRVAGAQDGYFPWAASEAIAADVRRSGADVVLVAMGMPRQELWMAEWGAQTGARLLLGVGAFLDFAAGAVPRRRGG